MLDCATFSLPLKIPGWVKNFAIFWYMLICGHKTKIVEVPAVIDSIMVVGVQTCCTLLYSGCDLKAEQMDMQYCLIQKFMLYKFELVKATKNICCEKGEGAVDHSIITK